MNEYRFAHPLVFLVIPLMILYLYRLWSQRWSTLSSNLRYSDIRLVRNNEKSIRLRLRHLPNLLQIIAWLGLVVAVARPQIGNTNTIIRGQGLDIVIAVDISGSMRIPDFSPRNRLDASKVVIQEFIQGREYDRIGLVVFANDSFQLAPPTLDYVTLNNAIRNLSLASDIGIQDGSAIGLGIASATNMLRSSTAQSKVIILLTDGENNVGLIDAVSASRAADALGIRIYTIGIGQRGVFSVTQPNSEIINITSNLDESSLENVASIAQGEYFYAADLQSLQAIYDRIDALERSPVERQQFTVWKDVGDSLIIVVFLLIVLERFLRHTIFQTIP